MDQNCRNTYQEFYSRQIGCLGIADQKKLHQKTVSVVGVGGLGCHLLMTLSLYGFKEIRLIDGDQIAYHNLHRQPLFQTKDTKDIALAT